MEKIDKYEGYSEYDKWQARKKTTLRLIYKYKRTTNYKYKEDLAYGGYVCNMDRAHSYNFKKKISSWYVYGWCEWVNGCQKAVCKKSFDDKNLKTVKRRERKKDCYDYEA